jgi:5-methylcytosine-specific restriction protein B
LLEELFKGEDKSEEETALVTYSRKDFLAEVFMEDTEYDRLVRLIETKKNVILQGPPGVGKTFASKRLAYSIMGKKDEKRVMMVQFHQNYSYEDFIMGFRPSKESFELNYGPFYEFCQTAKDHTGQKYFFIIDEINRGNLSKIFGELLMLIENDKRGEKLRLLYENELFSVPPNVHLIGLMNTADRSLALIDYALRRRFAFYEMKPAFDSDGFKKIIEEHNDTKFPKLINAVKDLNETISKDDNLGDGFRIGHSYFCPDDTIDTKDIDDWLKTVIEFELLPLLSEYWFDEKKKINEWKEKLDSVL